MFFLSYNFYFNWKKVIGYNQFITNGESYNLHMDPVKGYPSGVPQGINTIIDKIFTETIQIIQPVPVQGFLDNLIGQRMFIEVILFISCFFTILLIIAFFINLIFLLNKDKFIKFFDNKFCTLYFKYQAFIAKISLFYFPLFIALGLYTITHGLYWLFTHQIPFN